MEACAAVQQGLEARLAGDGGVDFRELSDAQGQLQVEQQVRPVAAMAGQQVEGDLAAFMEVDLEFAGQAVLRCSVELAGEERIAQGEDALVVVAAEAIIEKGGEAEQQAVAPGELPQARIARRRRRGS